MSSPLPNDAPKPVAISAEAVTRELRLIWKAQTHAGLQGKMCLYSLPGRPLPSKSPASFFWFGPDEVAQAVEFFLTHYNEGRFPYTPLLLNPIVYRQVNEGQYEPLGSAVIWAAGLDIRQLPADKMERVKSTGAAASYAARAENDHSGLKMVAFSRETLTPNGDKLVAGCEALFSLSDTENKELWPYYFLCGVSYPSNVGTYIVAPFEELFGTDVDEAILEHFTVQAQTLEDAAMCWERYDRKPTLYERFGNTPDRLAANLEFYDYCARDFELFDAIGPMSMKKQTKGEGGFDFLVHGLIPRGSIVLLAGTGGTGKSSIAHKLCCLAATDWRDDEQPMWLGQPLNKARSKGIVVYFSGEDGPAIINARNEIFDPEGRAQRLMFQRNHFVDAKGGEITFAEFLNRLRAMPEVPLLVVDPARKYLTGDEDDAAVVSEFFEAIEKFAHEREAAVIVVHHLSKGAKPQSAREVLDELRGSQVFIDRPRVVIGMFREGPKTVVGLAKCNIPPSLGMVTVERVFAHNPQTLDLTQLPGPDGVRDPYKIPEAEEE